MREPRDRYSSCLLERQVSWLHGQCRFRAQHTRQTPRGTAETVAWFELRLGFGPRFTGGHIAPQAGVLWLPAGIKRIMYGLPR